MVDRLRAACIALALSGIGIADVSAQVALEIQDFVVMPITGSVDGKGSNDVLLSRVNTLREEAGGASRLFISDLNGPLYILDKATKKFTVYLDFNGTEGKTGIFRKLTIAERLRQRAERLLSRSRLHAERQVLHGAHRGSSAARFQPSRQRALSRA